MARSKKLPHMPFYPGDWKKDLGVQSLDMFDRGVWHEMLLLMWDSEERGVLVINGKPMTELDIARAVGLDPERFSKSLANILEKGVCSIRADGAIFNRKQVRDEALSAKRAEAGSKGGSAKAESSKTPSKTDSKPEANPEQNPDIDIDNDNRNLDQKKNGAPPEAWNFSGAMDRAELREWAPKVREKLWRVGRTFGQFELEAALSNHGLEAVVAALRHTCQLTEPRNLCYPGDRNGSGGGKRKSKLDLELDEIRNA